MLGVSRTSKTPTSIYLANRGYKTVNIPLVLDQKIPNDLYSNKTSCIVGLIADPQRLSDIRRNRVAIMKDQNLKDYTDLESIKNEVEDSKNLFGIIPCFEAKGDHWSFVKVKENNTLFEVSVPVKIALLQPSPQESSPTTFPRTLRPSDKPTMSWSVFSMTCALVKTRPSLEKITPLP